MPASVFLSLVVVLGTATLAAVSFCILLFGARLHAADVQAKCSARKKEKIWSAAALGSGVASVVMASTMTGLVTTSSFGGIVASLMVFGVFVGLLSMGSILVSLVVSIPAILFLAFVEVVIDGILQKKAHRSSTNSASKISLNLRNFAASVQPDLVKEIKADFSAEQLSHVIAVGVAWSGAAGLISAGSGLYLLGIAMATISSGLVSLVLSEEAEGGLIGVLAGLVVAAVVYVGGYAIYVVGVLLEFLLQPSVILLVLVLVGLVYLAKSRGTNS